MNRHFRRAIPIVTALALALAACGGDDDTAAGADEDSADTTAAETPATSEVTAEESSETPDATTADTTADTAAFPVTIEHKFGEITIESEPERVVSIGFADQDWLLALGVTPIAIREWYGEFPYATWPWAQDELGDATPEVLPSTELNFEQIAALRPDLIVGVGSGMTDSDYDKLSQIAPTLAQPDDYIDYGVPWDVTTELIGKAVGKPAEAAALIEHVNGLYADARQANPDFEGATSAVAFYFENLPGAYSSSDSRSRLMQDLGFVTPPEFDELAGDSFYFSVSSEDIDTLDTDVLIWIMGSEEELPALANMATRPSLRAYAEGREVITDTLLSGAFSFASPLSIEYLLELLVPELALAVDGDPSTVVPSAQALLGDAPPTDDTSSTAAVLDADQHAAADAWSTVFDSTVSFDDKAAHLEDADALQPTVESYTTAGDAMGGISLVPTDVVIDGETATVTYDVMFGDSAAYTALTGEISNVDGTWTVSRSEFCSFMVSARNACPA